VAAGEAREVRGSLRPPPAQTSATRTPKVGRGQRAGVPVVPYDRVRMSRGVGGVALWGGGGLCSALALYWPAAVPYAPAVRPGPVRSPLATGGGCLVGLVVVGVPPPPRRYAPKNQRSRTRPMAPYPAALYLPPTRHSGSPIPLPQLAPTRSTHFRPRVWRGEEV